MKVFLDVGAHLGETVEAVRHPRYRMDQIFCFEPVQRCCEALRRIDDRRLTVLPFGLWRETCERPLFGAGGLAASLFEDMKVAGRAESEICRFVRASDWFRDNIGGDDRVYLKLNCEGAECDIVDDLLDSGEFDKVSFLMIDFDVRKIPSQKHREAQVRRRLKTHPFPRVSFCKDVMIGRTHEERIGHWLDMVEKESPAASSSMGRHGRAGWSSLWRSVRTFFS